MMRKAPDPETLKALCGLLRSHFTSLRDTANQSAEEWQAKSITFCGEDDSERDQMILSFVVEANTWQEALEIVNRTEGAWMPCSKCKQLASLLTRDGICMRCSSKKHRWGLPWW